MNKVVKITESDLNRLVKKTLTECVRAKVSRQLEKECVEALLECTTVAILESFFGDYVRAINENCTYTLNEAKLNETEQREIINEVYAIYEKSFIDECRRQLGEMMTEGEVNEFLPLVAGAASLVGKNLLGGLAKKAVGGLAKKAVGGIANRLGKGAIGNGIKNVVGGLGKNLLNGGLAQMASGAGAAGGGNLMNLLKNGGGNLANILGSNPGILNSLLGGGNGNAGGNNGTNLMSMLMNLISGGNGGGMASSLANMFGGSNSKSPSTAKAGTHQPKAAETRRNSHSKITAQTALQPRAVETRMLEEPTPTLRLGLPRRKTRTNR